jgi:serine/threonine protein kinase
MTRDQLERIKEIFYVVMDKPPEERLKLLAEACGGDAMLRAEVERLLAEHDRAGGFLKEPLDAAASLRNLAPLPLGLEPGQIIAGRFRIVSFLALGGMGVVYKAEDSLLGRAAALKFLPESVAGEPQALARFRREAQSASALNHPNICTIYDFIEGDGRAFIVMEYLDGCTLAELTGRSPGVPDSRGAARPIQPPSFDTLLRIAIEIADALAMAHAKGFIHRDIKPTNIFVETRGQAKILDFGLAKPALAARTTPQRELNGKEGRDSFITASPVMGSVCYMSPEQVRLEQLDARSDLFSFGAVLYEMFSGRKAFAADTRAMGFEAILQRTPAPARQFNPSLPAAVERIINKALEKDRSLRYQTANDMLSDLINVRVETNRKPGNVRGPLHLPRRLERVLIGVLAGLLLALCLWGLKVKFGSSVAHSGKQAVRNLLLSTTATLAVNPTKAAFGSLFTLTATVKDSNGNPLTNGSVTFYDAKAVLGIVQVVRTTSGGATIGTATLKTILVPLGANSLTAKYLGADASSTSAAVVATVTGTYSSSTSISDGGTPGGYTLTGTVAGAGPVSPTGDVAFTDTTTKASVGHAALNPATWSQTYVSASTITGLSNPEVVALVDVNGDGKPDLFIGSLTGLTVHLGNGDGTFQAPLTILSTSVPYRGLAFGDFDGDGKLDIAVSTGANIVVLFGNGDGTFRTGPSYDSGTIAEVAVGDFNADGILDLVASNSGTVDLLLGNADGTFQNPITYPVASPSSLAVGDVNGDGISDLVAATSPGAVSVFLGSTSGALQAGQTYTLQYQPGYMLLADFRGIGKLDLVTVFNQCCEGTNTAVNLMLGNGDGTFQSASTILSGINYSGAATGDFNGDGKLDLVVSDFGTPVINLLFGNGDGTFQTPVSYPAGLGPTGAAVADLNRDGRADIVVANYNDGTADVFLNQVTETATLASAAVVGTGQQSVTADYAGDANFAASTSAVVTLTGTAVEPVAAVSSSTLSFAAFMMKLSSNSQAITLSNAGNMALSAAVTARLRPPLTVRKREPIPCD